MVQRLYDFKAGTRISSDQVDAEFDQLIAAVNQVEADNNSMDADVRAKAQMSKVTNDTGGTKITVTSTSGDVLSEIVKLGKGVHTFYAVTNSKNLPPSGVSIRGIAHMTDVSYGWAWATDYRNNLYINYYDAPGGGWKGWKTILNSTDRTQYTNIPLQNGWKNYGGSDPTAQYKINGLGEVRIKGTIKGGTMASGTTLFTLPEGYRPQQRHIHVAQGNNDQFVRVLVETSGAVTLFTAMTSNGWLSLDGLTFDVV